MIENKKCFNVFLSKKYLTFTTFLNNNLRASGREELKEKYNFFIFLAFIPFCYTSNERVIFKSQNSISKLKSYKYW